MRCKKCSKARAVQRGWGGHNLIDTARRNCTARATPGDSGVEAAAAATAPSVQAGWCRPHSLSSTCCMHRQQPKPCQRKGASSNSGKTRAHLLIHPRVLGTERLVAKEFQRLLLAAVRRQGLPLALARALAALAGRHVGAPIGSNGMSNSGRQGSKGIGRVHRGRCGGAAFQCFIRCFSCNVPGALARCLTGCPSTVLTPRMLIQTAGALPDLPLQQRAHSAGVAFRSRLACPAAMPLHLTGCTGLLITRLCNLGAINAHALLL